MPIDAAAGELGVSIRRASLIYSENVATRKLPFSRYLGELAAVRASESYCKVWVGASCFLTRFTNHQKRNALGAGHSLSSSFLLLRNKKVNTAISAVPK